MLMYTFSVSKNAKVVWTARTEYMLYFPLTFTTFRIHCYCYYYCSCWTIQSDGDGFIELSRIFFVWVHSTRTAIPNNISARLALLY